MSIDYCEKHNRRFDTDYELDGCVWCYHEDESFIPSPRDYIVWSTIVAVALLIAGGFTVF